MLAAVIAEGVCVLLLGLLVAGLLRSHAEILRALHQLGAGREDDALARPSPQPITTTGTQEAHDIVGRTLTGADAAVAVVGTRHDTLLAFLSSGCYTCEPFWSALAAGTSVPGNARLLVVVQDEDSAGRLRQLAGPDLDVVVASAAWQDYEVPGSPHFVYVSGPHGRVIGEGTGQTWEQVRDMLDQFLTDRPADERDNAQRVDRELLAAGIGPGHPSLHGPVEP